MYRCIHVWRCIYVHRCIYTRLRVIVTSTQCIYRYTYPYGRLSKWKRLLGSSQLCISTVRQSLRIFSIFDIGTHNVVVRKGDFCQHSNSMLKRKTTTSFFVGPSGQIHHFTWFSIKKSCLGHLVWPKTGQRTSPKSDRIWMRYMEIDLWTVVSLPKNYAVWGGSRLAEISKPNAKKLTFRYGMHLRKNVKDILTFNRCMYT